MDYPVKKAVVASVIGTACVASTVWLAIAVLRAIAVPGASDWLVPVAAASATGTMFFVYAILVRRVAAVAVVVGGMMVALAAIAPTWATALFVVPAGLMLARAWQAVRQSVDSHLRIAVFAHTQQGASRLVLALALAIAGVLFYAIAHTDAASLIMSGSMRTAFRSPLARMVMPAPVTQGTGPGGQATVDDFLRSVAADGAAPADGGEGVGVRFMEDYAGAVGDRVRTTALGGGVTSATSSLTPAVLTQMREDLGREMGMSLTGQELVSDIFVTSLERNMQSYAEHNLLPAGYRYGTALAGVITFFLFMTIWGVGAIVQIFWGILAKVVVAVLIRTDAVAVTRRMVEKEEIA